MKIEIKVPQLPESVSEAVLLNWHKKSGEFVRREENLIDLETDKVVLELPAPEDGALVEIIGKPGAVVKSGEIIAYYDTSAVAAAASATKPVTPTAKSTEPSAAEKSAPTAMPAAAKIAADNQLALNNLSGSGRGGRILKEDVLKSLHSPSSRPEERVAMSRLRKRVAERLLYSQQSNAILTTFNEVNLQPVMDLRAKYKEVFEKKHGVKLGFMSFFVKAAIAALRQYPIVNASVDGEDIVYHGYFDIGIAVGSPRGLVVPILRNAETLSIAAIEQQIADFGARAKDGKLEIEELTGGTFSITNGGTFGSMMSTPIINPPQAAILGMHATKERAVVENGQIVIRPMMYLALSYDHRIIDGREAVLTLVAIKNAVEDPARLLLDL
jgi:2-oxoglutarate dehydrogenase E2 component (dihydrolipoamide succinyltransferase)